jgi:hypothetical protein
MITTPPTLATAPISLDLMNQAVNMANQAAQPNQANQNAPVSTEVCNPLTSIHEPVRNNVQPNQANQNIQANLEARTLNSIHESTANISISSNVREPPTKRIIRQINKESANELINQPTKPLNTDEIKELHSKILNQNNDAPKPQRETFKRKRIPSDPNHSSPIPTRKPFKQGSLTSYFKKIVPVQDQVRDIMSHVDQLIDFTAQTPYTPTTSLIQSLVTSATNSLQCRTQVLSATTTTTSVTTISQCRTQSLPATTTTWSSPTTTTSCTTTWSNNQTGPPTTLTTQLQAPNPALTNQPQTNTTQADTTHASLIHNNQVTPNQPNVTQAGTNQANPIIKTQVNPNQSKPSANKNSQPKKVTFAQPFDFTSINDYSLSALLQEGLAVIPVAVHQWRAARSAYSAQAKALSRADHLQLLLDGQNLPKWAVGVEPLPGYLEPLLVQIITLKNSQGKELLRQAITLLRQKAEDDGRVGRACLQTVESLYHNEHNRAGWDQAHNLLTAVITSDRQKCDQQLQKRFTAITDNPITQEEYRKALIDGPRNQGNRAPKTRQRSRSPGQKRQQQPRTTGPNANRRSNNSENRYSRPPSRDPRTAGQARQQRRRSRSNSRTRVTQFSRFNNNSRARSSNNTDNRSQNSLWNESRPARGRQPLRNRQLNLTEDEAKLIRTLRDKN